MSYQAFTIDHARTLIEDFMPEPPIVQSFVIHQCPYCGRLGRMEVKYLIHGNALLICPNCKLEPLIKLKKGQLND